LPETGDPTKELRTYIEGLQNEARQARLQQEAAEEERDRLAEEVRRLQRESQGASQARKDVRDLATERDGLLAEREKQQLVTMELRRKIEGSERLRTQVEIQRDEAVNLYKELRKQADQHVGAREEAIRQRDAAHRQRVQAARERDELATRFQETQRQLAEAQKALVDAEIGASKKNDGETQRQITALRQARDSAYAQVAEFRERIAELEDAIANLTYDREVSDNATKRAMVELETFRAKAEADAQKAQLLETLQEELAEVGEELTTLRELYAAEQGAKGQLIAQLREFRETHEGMLVANTSRIESAIKERDTLRTRLQERETELVEVRAELAAAWAGAMQVTEPEIQRLTQEVEGMKAQVGQAEQLATNYDEMLRQREAMRLQVIELNAKLENARREIKEIGAQLAEARLQLKLAGKSPGILNPGRGATGALADASGAIVPRTPDSATLNRVAAMRSAFDQWAQHGEDAALLWELAREVAAFSGSKQAAGEQTLYRLSARLTALIESMLEAPGNALPSFVQTIEETIELIGSLEAIGNLDQIATLAGAKVFVVDDDVDACAALSDVLQQSGFVVEATEHASTALAQLSAKQVDLILMDVRMPEVDGFELCGYLQAMELHASTPVLFVTGDREVEFGGRPGVAFLNKPFHTDELALRAMTLVVKAQVSAL
jgi:CheY-like chemotaxis protein